MAYTTSEEIQSDFKDISFTSATNVTEDDVTQFIVEADALINAYVGAIYTVPVATAGGGLSLLKLLSRSLVTARIKKIMEVKQEKSVDGNQNVVGVFLSPKEVMKILSDIKDDVLKLEGAESLASGGGFYSNNYSNDVEAKVEKDSKQW